MENKPKNPKYYWSVKEHVIDESMKYTSRTAFKKGSYNAYKSALKNKWISEMPWLDVNNSKKPKGYWKDKDNMMAEAKKYKNKDEFKKGNLTAFLAGYRYGYIDDMVWMVKKKRHKNGYWTYKHIEEEAVKYTTKTDFFRGCPTAYRAALKLGVIDDFFITNYIQY